MFPVSSLDCAQSFLTWPAKSSPSCSLAWVLNETFLLVCSLVILVTISRVPSSVTSFFSRNFCTATNLSIKTHHTSHTCNQINHMADFQLSTSSRFWIQLLQWQTHYLWKPQSSSDSSSFLGAFQVRGAAPKAWKVKTTSEMCRGSLDLFSRKMLTWLLLPTVPLGYTCETHQG